MKRLVLLCALIGGGAIPMVLAAPTFLPTASGDSLGEVSLSAFTIFSAAGLRP